MCAGAFYENPQDPFFCIKALATADACVHIAFMRCPPPLKILLRVQSLLATAAQTC